MLHFRTKENACPSYLPPHHFDRLLIEVVGSRWNLTGSEMKRSKTGSWNTKAAAVTQAPAEFVDTAAASLFTGLSEKTLTTWRSRNRGPRYYKVGRAVRYAIADLRDFMSRSPRNATSTEAQS